jgi:tetratricopeptide (TPR) repeat protein
LALGVVVSYGGTLGNGFVHDDRSEILENRFVHDLAHVRDILATPSWGFERQRGETPGEGGYRAESNYYRPVQYLTYAVLYRLFGPSAWAFHLYKIILHLAACLALFAIVAHHRETLALPCALLFAVHPALSEAVAWVSAVTDVTCGLCFLLGLAAYQRWRRHPRWSRLALVHAAFLIGVFSKETMVVFIPVLLLYQRLVEGEWPRGSDWTRVYLPLAATTLVYLAARLAVLRSFLVAGRQRFAELSGFRGFLNQVALSSDYLLKFLWPEPLNAFHVLDPVLSIRDVRLGAAVLVMGSAVLVACVLARRLRGRERSLFLFGAVWAACALAPAVILFRRVGENVFAERYLYLPAAGLCLCTVAALSGVARRRPAPFAVCFLLLAVAGVWRVRARVPVWHDQISFYEDVQRQSPKAPFWQSLADAYAAAGRFSDAVRAHRVMLALRPDSYQTYCNLGIVYDHMGRLDDAVGAYLASLAILPNEMAYSNLGIAYHKLGRYDAALEAYGEAIELRPTSRAYFNLGTTYYLGLRRFDDAMAAYEAALALMPENHEARHALALVREERRTAAKPARAPAD